MLILMKKTDTYLNKKSLSRKEFPSLRIYLYLLDFTHNYERRKPRELGQINNSKRSHFVFIGTLCQILLL